MVSTSQNPPPDSALTCSVALAAVAYSLDGMTAPQLLPYA